MRLDVARHILEAVELGVCPSGPVRYHPAEPGPASGYYLNRYGALAEEAAALRERLRCLGSLS